MVQCLFCVKASLSKDAGLPKQEKAEEDSTPGSLLIEYPVTQIIEFNDFWTFDNFSKTEFFSTFEVYFDIYKPFSTDWDEKWGDNLILI